MRTVLDTGTWGSETGENYPVVLSEAKDPLVVVVLSAAKDLLVVVVLSEAKDLLLPLACSFNTLIFGSATSIFQGMPRITRPRAIAETTMLLRIFPVVAILGARQVGKTTLALQLATRRRKSVTRFDLEDLADRERLAEPMLTLRPLRGTVIIDEVQHSPDLFMALRVLADEPRVNRRFLVLGSASPGLLRQSSESLAGRIAYQELGGFTLGDVGANAIDRLWLRGGFPRAYLAASNADSVRWRSDFLRTYVERDLPQLGLNFPAATLQRFWTMLAHYHAQTWNASELARAFGVSHHTVRNWLDALTDTFMVRQLLPWHENISKRQVKAPRIYLRDSGLLHALLGITSREDLLSHPKLGASWEGFALENVLAQLGARPHEAYGWGTHGGAELDLLVVRGRTRLGFEFKRTSAPKVTPSMRSALETLKLDRLDVIHAGPHLYDMADGIRAVPLASILDAIKPLAP